MVRLLFTLAVLVPSAIASADYSDDCGSSASALSSAAEMFTSKMRSFKSACDQYYGYSKDDESACGEFGYLRSGLKSAAREVDDENDNVSRSCGTCDGIANTAYRATARAISDLKKENEALKQRVAQLESENAQLRKSKQ